MNPYMATYSRAVYAMFFVPDAARHSENPAAVLLPYRARLALPPLVLLDTRAERAELLLIAKSPMGEREWGQLIEAHRPQTMQLIEDAHQGAACVESMLRRLNPPPSELFDAFRMLSDGRMHPHDTREWCMTARSLRQMRIELRELDLERQQRMRDRVEASRLIECSDGVVYTASALWRTIESYDPALQSQRRSTMEAHAIERSALEAREIDLIRAVAELECQCQAIATVLRRQEVYRGMRGCMLPAYRLLGTPLKKNGQHAWTIA